MSLGPLNPASLALSNKFLPVHCIVARDECPSRILQDGFVIVPAQTKFHDIVSVVLRTMEADVGKIEQDERADGQILIKNWNPLPIPTVSENRSTTVQDILGDLMNVAILKIQICKVNSEEKRSTSFFKPMMPLVNDDREKTLSINRFYTTVIDETEDDEDVQHQSTSSKPTTSPNGYSYTSSNSNTNDGDNIPLNLSTKQYSSPSSSSIPSNNAKAFLNYPFASLLSLASQSSNIVPSYESSSIYSASSSPMKDYPSYNRRQRERTTFDPHEETPRLLQIFTDTKHPTRYQIASICESLNALPCRKGKKALEPYNIQYWFKNARAALKRKKRRFASSDSTHPPNNLTSEDFASPHRTTNDDEQVHPSIKCELDSSDELDADEVDEDETMELEEKQKQPINHPNYFFNCLRAFDISLTDHQQRVKHGQSEESNDDDNISSISEQSPPTQISYHHSSTGSSIAVPSTKTTSTFDYNRSRRNRIFIDPTSEVPKLEQWFAIETHPDHILIERICSELNEGEYRRKFPKLESKHIRLWFKNHRAKVKRICRIQAPANNDNAVETNSTSNPTEKKID